MKVSIHALLAECDRLFCLMDGRTISFQSTHSLRSATGYCGHIAPKSGSFNPRTPCGVRLVDAAQPLVELKFQSTHSLRSATVGRQNNHHGAGVSIHALLAECDPCAPRQLRLHAGFNPRTPCGVRRRVQGLGGSPSGVSIHALLAECDPYRLPQHKVIHSFNPRTPCGVRPVIFRTMSLVTEFQSTHSLRSAT